MLTNVRTGATFPSIDPSGEWLYFSGYHVDGWEVERTRFRGPAAPPAPDVDARFDRPATTDRQASGEPMEGYRAGLTLAPTYWEISYSEPIAFAGVTTSDGDVLRRREGLGHALGIQTTGRDVVGRHSYSLFGRIFTETPKVEAGIAYANLSLGSPIVSVSATQRFGSAGQVLGGTAPNQDTLFILRRERRLQGALTFRAPRWRYDLSVTASAAWLMEHNELLDRRMESTSAYQLSRPDARAGEMGLSTTFVTARSHSFQMGMTRGVNLFAMGRVQREFSLPDSLRGVSGADRSFAEATGRARAAIPLWSTGRVTHVLALQASGGVASGAGAGAGHFFVGGASGRPENLTGAELFGGDFIFFPVRGYGTAARFGRYAWSATAEYRFPLLMLNRGVGAWPVHFDRVLGSFFVDAGNAWGPDLSPSGFVNTMRTPLASIGAEVTTEVLGRFDIELRLRTGLALTLVSGTEAVGYLRVGLPF